MKKEPPVLTKEQFEVIQWVLDPKVIDGALRSAIHAHGPISLGTRKLRVIELDVNGNEMISEITTCSTSSASKRIRGAIRTRVVEYLKKKSEKPPKMWYRKWITVGQALLNRD